MQVGIFMQPVHDPAGNMTEQLRQDRELIKLADRLGFAECWIGEHFTATVEPIASPLAFMASLIPETSQIRFGTGVFCLPQQHPVVVAAQAAQFDHMSDGRFMMGIGAGGLSSDFEVFGTGDPQARAAMLQEAMEMILRLWAEDPPYDIQGAFWNIQIREMDRIEFGVGAIPKPLQQPHPPIAISLLSPDSASARLAGRKGWIPISGSCLVQPRYARNHWEAYADAMRAEGRQPDPSVWRVTRSVWVAESDAEAEDYLMKPGGVFDFYFRYVISAVTKRKSIHLVRPDGREQDASVDQFDIARSQVAWGSPATVLDRLVAFSEAMGPYGTLLLTAHEWDEPVACRRSMTLFAEQVLPKLRQHLSVQRAAE